MTKGKRKETRKKRSFFSRFLRFVFVIALLVGFFWCEQNLIVTEKVEVGAVPPAFAGMRIALISDIHGKEFGERNEVLLKKVAKLDPDIIAVTGDIVHEGVPLSILPPLAKGLSQIAPTYYVTGNHEWATHQVPEIKELLSSNGVRVLSNEYVMFEREGQRLALLGADDNNGNADQKTIAELADEVRDKEGQDTYLLLLSHRNNRYKTYEAARIDLTLSGHAHGGQVRIPFTDGLIGPHREFLPEYTAGRYPLAYGEMFVSRGLSDQWPAFRLFNRPDLPLLTLQSAP